MVLDSGAFSADQKGTEVDVYKYMDFIRENKVKLYFNLDVIGSAEGSWKNQEIMEKSGFSPLPVFHVEDEERYLDRCISDYRYFALGGMAGGVSEQSRERFLDRCWEKICPAPTYMPTNKVHGLGLASPLLISKYPWYCMTEEDHTVLTKSGWKALKDLTIGTEILCFNKGVSKWEEILEIPIFPVINATINRMFNRNFDSFTSDNHRWNIFSRKGEYKWKTEKEFVANDTIPRIGEYTFPTKKIYSDEQVSALAWFWTDGTIKGRKNYKSSSIVLYQSVKANPQKCDIIRDILIKSGEKYCEMKPTGGNGIIAFELYGELCKWLLSIAPNKELPEFLPLQLTKGQTNLFIEQSILADGFRGRLVRTDGFGISVSRGYKRKNLEILRIMCLLYGIPTSMNYTDGYSKLASSSVNRIYIGNVTKEKVKYTGNLWCVRVPSGAFFTKCKEKIYVTGNSADTASGIHYGRYGIIIIPRMKHGGEPDYLSPPYSIYITERSSTVQVEGKHIRNVAPSVRKWIYEYIVSRGFAVGKIDLVPVPKGYELQEGEKFTGKEKVLIERVIEPGVVSNGTIRDYFNLDFYLQMEKAIPAWPWPYKPKMKRMF